MKNHNQKILLYLGHPAHYHNLKVVAENLVNHGCEVLFVARQKDVLFDLLNGSTIETIFLPARKSGGAWGMMANILQREWKMLKIIRRFKPDIMAGTDIVIAHLGRLLNIPSVLINEDDLDEVPLFAHYGVRFCSVNLAPDVCRVKGYEHKTLHYKSYHELAYLHPDHFTPQPELIENDIDTSRPFFILRFAQLTAHHDKGRTGITDDIALQLIDMLKDRGQIYITSERPLEPQFEKYRIAIPPALMHHALATARLYIGDSQTMAAEAAVLGIPSIRFNDFVGRLSYLEDLEHKYGLTKGIRTSEPEKLLLSVGALLNQPDVKELYRQRRELMLSEKSNLANLWTDFLLHYPHQKSIAGFYHARSFS